MNDERHQHQWRKEVRERESKKNCRHQAEGKRERENRVFFSCCSHGTHTVIDACICIISLVSLERMLLYHNFPHVHPSFFQVSHSLVSLIISPHCKEQKVCLFSFSLCLLRKDNPKSMRSVFRLSLD